MLQISVRPLRMDDDVIQLAEIYRSNILQAIPIKKNEQIRYIEIGHKMEATQRFHENKVKR